MSVVNQEVKNVPGSSYTSKKEHPNMWPLASGQCEIESRDWQATFTSLSGSIASGSVRIYMSLASQVSWISSHSQGQKGVGGKRGDV